LAEEFLAPRAEILQSGNFKKANKSDNNFWGSRCKLSSVLTNIFPLP